MRTHHHVMVADVLRAVHQMESQLQGGKDRLPVDGNLPLPGGRTIPSAGQPQRNLFGVADQAVAVRGDTVMVPQEAQPPGALGAGGYLSHSDGLKNIFDAQQRVPIGRHGLRRTRHHLLGAASGGNQSHAGFDQPHVTLRRGVNAGRMERHLQAPAQRQSERGGHHRLRGILQRHRPALESADHFVDLFPFAFLNGHQHQHQIGAGGKVDGLVADDHRFKIFLQQAHSRLHHLQGVGAERVHLGVELEAEGSVAQVEQARTGVPADFALGLPNRAEQEQSGLFLDRLMLFASQIEAGSSTVPALIEGFLSAVQERFQQLGRPAPSLIPLGDDVPYSDGIEELKKTQLPVESPLQSPVEGNDIVGDLRNAAGGVVEDRRQQLPIELPGPARRFIERPDAPAGVFDIARRLQRRELGAFSRLVFVALEVKRVNLALFPAPDAPVEALPGLLTEPISVQHLFDERRQPVDLPLLVAGDFVVDVPGHAHGNVQPDKIQRAEGGRLRQSERGSGERVDLLHRVAVFGGNLQDLGGNKRPDSIGDEVRSVFGDHHPLAQDRLTEISDGINHVRQGVRGGNQLQQLHVARRVEKVRSQPVTAEIILKPFAEACK